MTASASIDEQMKVLMRGVQYGDANIQRTMEEELRARLAEGRPLRVYAGFDPTAIDLHLGHLVPMFKMRQFQQFGHEVTFLIGTMTAVIGDPTDRSAARTMQTVDEVNEKAETWLGQAFRILDAQKTRVARNGDWLAPLSLADFVGIASNFTVQQFLDHETFRRRIDEQRPIYLHEFVYALMQGYDAQVLNTDVQIGGTEQLFNMMAGRTLQRANGQKPHIAICLPILIGTDGRLRMSKSTGNYIGLDDAPADMYGKVMSITDEMIMNYFTLVTTLPNEEVAAIEKALAERTLNPMQAKKRLAWEIVAELNDSAAADAAQAEFERVHQRGEDPTDSAVEVRWESLDKYVLKPTDHGFAASEEMIIDGRQTMRLANLISDTLGRSVSDVRRLIQQGAVAVDGEVATETLAAITRGTVIKVGRHEFIKVMV